MVATDIVTWSARRSRSGIDEDGKECSKAEIENACSTNLFNPSSLLFLRITFELKMF
jgi:hypothetical protein